MSDHPDPWNPETVIGTTADGKPVTARIDAPLRPAVTDYDPAGSLTRWAVVPARRGGEGKTTAEFRLPMKVTADEAAWLLDNPLGDDARALIDQIIREGRKTPSPKDRAKLFGLDHLPAWQYATVEELDAAAGAELDPGREAPEAR